jgi:hypothetical protein
MTVISPDDSQINRGSRLCDSKVISVCIQRSQGNRGLSPILSVPDSLRFSLSPILFSYTAYAQLNWLPCLDLKIFDIAIKFVRGYA